MSRIEKLSDGVTLYLGDSRELWTHIRGVDAVVSDPPYGIDHKVERTGVSKKWSKRTNERIIGDKLPFDPSLWINHKAILWGANHYADKLPISGGWVVFDKRRGGTHNQKFIASDCELAWSNSFGSVKIFSHLWAGICRDTEVGKHFHPMQKPVALMEFCIGLLPGINRICDPFMGSGSTGVAAVNLGKEFIGVEIEEKYFDIACKRIGAALDAPSKQEVLL